ncbi:disulfide bond formation protein B [Parasulfitobacter algicola]|uniref:Disulfide bond formation protein B n=1 Tax=Parasulfitobacter algicola TaxID=2614809 RepID=A0ABX2IW44_9RHOB|nr:disulfide bond formation protein B [Sulfitobacter algicola]NSX55285.1 disulfide bond formation protein B [Sulfitobacter algicola]
MTSRTLVILAASGSMALLMGAWAFQYIGGLAPCQMCYWQRWPHMAAVAFGAAAVAFGTSRLWMALGALAALATALIGVYHAGVEQKWWAGPQSCSGGGLSGLSGADLLSLDGPGIVMCDQIAWQMLGISMAGWNALASFGLAGLWVWAMLKHTKSLTSH